MKMAAAIVTDRGGRTCHAAIVSRELGVPCIVGTGARDRQRSPTATRSRCPARRAKSGAVYARRAARSSAAASTSAQLPRPRNASHDERRQSRPGLPAGRPAERRRGTGARGVHHRQRRSGSIRWRCSHPDRRRPMPATRAEIAALDRGYAEQAATTSSTASPRASAMIAAAFYPKDVIVRLSRLQDQRVRQPARRPRLRAEGRESDARLPRRLALLRTRATARASRSSAGRCRRCARRWG